MTERYSNQKSNRSPLMIRCRPMLGTSPKNRWSASAVRSFGWGPMCASDTIITWLDDIRAVYAGLGKGRNLVS